MAKFEILFKSSVEKDLSKLPKKAVRQLFSRIECLTNDPFPSGSLKLAGLDNLYRIRSGDYRVIYSVDQGQKLVTIQYIRHRKDVYKDL